MAIINNFPVSDSELVKVYENPDIFPGILVCRDNSRFINNNGSRVIVWYDDHPEDSQSFNISVIPVRTVNIIPTSDTYPNDDVPTITMTPGHVYSIHRDSTNYGAGRGQGRYTLKEDGVTIHNVESNSLRYSDYAFTWSLPDE